MKRVNSSITRAEGSKERAGRRGLGGEDREERTGRRGLGGTSSTALEAPRVELGRAWQLIVVCVMVTLTITQLEASVQQQS